MDVVNVEQFAYANALKGCTMSEDAVASLLQEGTRSMPAPKQRPPVSVITVTKDDPVGLIRTVASVRSQMLKICEHIIVDGSERPDHVLLESCRAGGAKVIMGVGGGPYSAMNAGASAATGNVLCFLNSGDTFFSPHALGYLVGLSARARWGYGAVLIVDQYGSSRVYHFTPFRRWMLLLGVRYVPHPASFIERKLFEEAGGFDCSYPVAADQKLFLILSELHRPAVSTDPLTEFHLGGASTRSTREAALDFARMRRELDGPLLGSPLLDGLATLAIGSSGSIIRAFRQPNRRP